MAKALKLQAVLAVACIICLLLPLFPACAAEPFQPSSSEVVFLLDASKSMNQNDPQQLALDSVKQMAYSLPSNYGTGFVAFNNGVTVSAPITRGEEWDRIEKLVDSVQYTGYTDAGSGLQAAVDQLLASDAPDRKLVLLSDGEIAMANQAQTDESVQKYQAALEQAVSQNIPLYLIALGPEMADTSTNLYQSFQKNGGRVYPVKSADELQDAVRTLLFEEFQIKKTSVGLSETTAAQNQMQIKIPAQHTSKARVLVTANQTIENISANYNASNGNIIRGKRFSIVEVDQPGRQTMELNLTVPEGSQIRADLITEYSGVLESGVAYEDIDSETQTSRTANVWIGVRHPDNPDLFLFGDPYYDQKMVPVTINGEIKNLPLNGGKLLYCCPVEQTGALEISAPFASLDTNLILDTVQTQVSLEAPPPLEIPEPDYRPLWVLLSLLGMALAAFLIRLLIQRRKHRPLPPEPVVSRYEFSGKLNFYITQAPDDTDIPPQTYNLYRIFSKSEITLAKILEDCGIRPQFEGADQISFVPGTNHSLVVTNHSDCSILKGREMLIKKHSYPVHFEEKLYITFEDEKSELELHYKSVKPGERK